MLNSKYTKVVLLCVASASTLVAGFPEPFDMHCTVKEIVKEKMEADQKKGSQDYFDHKWDLSHSSNSGSSGGTEKESRNDNDSSSNSQDHR